MKYTAPPGSADPNASYITGNPVTKVKGSPVPAEAVEHPQREIVNAIIAAGIVPDPEDLTQLTQAIEALAIGVGPGIATPLVNGVCRPDNYSLVVDASGELSVSLKNLRIPIWLTANRTWYVNGTTGNDANTGDTAATAFKTINAAIKHVTMYYNVADSVATIDVANGTYNEQVLLRGYARQSGRIRIQGHGGAIIAKSEMYVVNSSVNSATWVLNNLTLQCSLSEAFAAHSESGALNVANGTFVVLSDVTVVSTRAATSTLRPRYLLRVQQGGELQINPGCSISASGPLSSSLTFFIVTEGMVWLLGDSANVGATSLTLSGTVDASIWVMTRGYFRREPTAAATIAGTVTGKRYTVSELAMIFSSGAGANFFPGSVAGTVATGGYYA